MKQDGRIMICFVLEDSLIMNNEIVNNDNQKISEKKITENEECVLPELLKVQYCTATVVAQKGRYYHALKLLEHQLQFIESYKEQIHFTFLRHQ